MELDEPLVRRLIRDYPIDDFSKLEKLGTGPHFNDVKVTSKDGEYVVRHIRDDPESINRMMYIYDKLAETGFPAARPFKTYEGNYFAEIAVDYFVIQEYITGSLPTTNDKKETIVITKKVAKMLADIHNATSEIDWDRIEKYQPDFTNYNIVSKLETVKLEDEKIFFPEINVYLDDQFVVEQFRLWRNTMKEIDLSSLQKGLCHNDLKLSDIRLNYNNNITGVLNLDSAGWNYFLFDLASFMMYTGLYRENIAPLFLNIFMSEYIQQSEMMHSELQHIQFFVHSRFLMQVLMYYTRIQTNQTQGVDAIEVYKTEYQNGIDLLKEFSELPDDYYYSLVNA